MKQAVLPLLSLIALALVGCSSKELTRSKAQQIIEQSDLYKLGKHNIAITRDEAIGLVNRHYGKWVGFGVSQLVITEAGKQYFDSMSGEAMAMYNPFTAPLIVVPKVPIRPVVVEITGITGEATDTKTVDYRWAWESARLPNEVRMLIPSLLLIHNEETTFKLYDDGWRILWKTNKPI